MYLYCLQQLLYCSYQFPVRTVNNRVKEGVEAEAKAGVKAAARRIRARGAIHSGPAGF
jgi:hypothetical protein